MAKAPVSSGKEGNAAFRVYDLESHGKNRYVHEDRDLQVKSGDIEGFDSPNYRSEG